MSNLAFEIRELRTRLGEPSRSEPSDEFFTDAEFLEWIYQGELQVARDLDDGALYSLLTTTSTATVASTATYTIPTDFMRLSSVRLDFDGTWGKQRCDIVGLEEFERASTSPLAKGTRTYPIATFHENKVIVNPTPDGVNGTVDIRYVKRPTHRFLYFSGKTDGAGTTATLVDASAGGANDLYNTHNVRIASGILSGDSRTISDYTASTGTFTVSVAYATVPGTGIEFDVGAVTDLPIDLYPLYLDYASHLAMRKDRETDESDRWLLSYRHKVDTVNARYKDLHASNPVPMERPR